MRTPENERREVDLLVVAHMLWQFRESVHLLPERIAAKVADLFRPTT